VIHDLLLPVVEVKDVDGRDEAGHDELGTLMLINFRMLTVASAVLLSACAQFERNTSPQATVDDDAYCRANGGEPGSSAYVACRKARDVQSSRAAGSNSRIERSHRNLAEDMLNNPR